MKTDPMWCFENYGEAAQFIDELEQQRDELLAAVLAVCCDPDGNVVIHGSDGDRAVLQAAIAKVQK